jgi:hypothetical protein
MQYSLFAIKTRKKGIEGIVQEDSVVQLDLYILVLQFWQGRKIWRADAQKSDANNNVK